MCSVAWAEERHLNKHQLNILFLVLEIHSNGHQNILLLLVKLHSYPLSKLIPFWDIINNFHFFILWNFSSILGCIKTGMASRARSPPLLCPGRTTSTVLRPVLGSSVQERQNFWREPRRWPQRWLGTWSISLWGKAGSPGTIYPGEEKAEGWSDQCLQISEGQRSSTWDQALFSGAQ